MFRFIPSNMGMIFPVFRGIIRIDHAITPAKGIPMNFTKECFSYASSDGHSAIAAKLYLPKGELRAMVQLSHGMCEYVARYEHLIDYLCGQGFGVCGNDHLGHRDTAAANSAMKGYFGPPGSYRFLVQDLYALTKQMKRRFPELPYFLLGHSMGSFVARLYLTDHGDQLQGAILSGTGGANPASGLARTLAKTICRAKGDTYLSPLLHKLTLGGNNKGIPEPLTAVEWLSRDRAVVEAYLKDPGCAFGFTAAANYDLVTLLHLSNQAGWFASVPKKLPLLLVAGDRDPVGAFGTGVRQVRQRLQEAGVEQVDLRLYPQARHEVFNETNKQEAYEDLAAWLGSILEKT